MLREKYTYVAFDFETTGLDVVKDEPIQIGIVTFDHTGNPIDSYMSPIKPRKNIKKLKDIVRFITGSTLEDVEQAPHIEEIIPEIAKFFGPTTVVVGHNISFDVAMLQKYLDWTPAHMIDTYTRSRALFHYKKSYALGVLDQEITGDQGPDNKVYHDALEDSYASVRVFMAGVERIHYLRREYLIVDYVLEQTLGSLAAVIERSTKSFNFAEKKLFFPALKKEFTSNKKVVHTQPQEITLHSDAYIGNTSFSSLIKDTQRDVGPVVLAFTHRSKAQIAQNYFNAMGIKTGSLHDGVIFDQDMVNRFLHKESFTEAEALFVLKYFSHIAHQHAMMDINSPSDYTIFYALTKRKSTSSHKIRLCTHLQLFQLQKNIDKEVKVLFFDKERWYQNYSRWLKEAFDPMHRISHLEKILYKYELLGEETHIELYRDYMQQNTLFVGILGGELDKLYLKYPESKRDVDYIIGNPRFPRTTAAFQHLRATTQAILSQDDTAHDLLYDKRSLLENYLTQPATIEKKMFNGDERWYLLHQQDVYTSYEDFRSALPAAQYTFLSNSDKTLAPLIAKPSQSTPRRSSMSTIGDTTPLIKDIQKQHHALQFVLSSSKNASQKLFEACMRHKIHTTHTIVAENITGGIGKSIYQARTSTQPTICIGGYNFFFACLGEKFDFQHIYLYHIYGTMKQQIVHDLWWYSS